MLLESARGLVLLLGAAICLLSVWGLARPSRLVGFVGDVAERPSGIYVAIGVRVLLGAALLVVAADSRFPLAFNVLGWITLAAAAVLAVVQRRGMRRAIGWMRGMATTAVRLWLVAGLVLGVVLVYGAT